MRRELKGVAKPGKLPELIPSQNMVAQMVAYGLPDKEIAALLGVSMPAVKRRVSTSLPAIGGTRRAQLIRYMFETDQFDSKCIDIFLKAKPIAS